METQGSETTYEPTVKERISNVLALPGEVLRWGKKHKNAVGGLAIMAASFTAGTQVGELSGRGDAIEPCNGEEVAGSANVDPREVAEDIARIDELNKQQQDAVEVNIKVPDKSFLGEQTSWDPADKMGESICDLGGGSFAYLPAGKTATGQLGKAELAVAAMQEQGTQP